MAADAPDRNLRFVLGHAFTLDKVLLRVAEIENIGEIEPQFGKDALGKDEVNEQQAGGIEPQEGQTGSLAGGVVAFRNEDVSELRRKKQAVRKEKRTMPPVSLTQPKDNKADVSDENDTASDDDYDDIENNDFLTYSDEEDSAKNNDDGLGLTRYASASAAPPRMISPDEDKSDSDEEDNEPDTPPSLPSDFDYETLIAGEDNTELSKLYQSVQECPCHDHQDEKCAKVWEVKNSSPGMEGKKSNKTLVVMQLDTSFSVDNMPTGWELS